MPKKTKRKQIKVIEKKLGRHQAWGQASYEDYCIEIDERLKGKKRLEITIHEATHIIHPKLVEERVIEISILLTNLLWNQGWRRVEGDSSIPLQDGKK